MAGLVNRLKFIFSADTREFRKQTNEGKAAVQGFASQGRALMDKFASAFGVNTRAMSDSLNSFSKTASSVSRGFTTAASGSNALSAALKVLKVALISTGIGALIVALGSLVAYFTKTQRGADKVRLVMESFKAIINVLIDRLASFGEGIFLIFTGKFKQGAEKLGAAFKGVGEEIKTEAKLAWELEKRWQALQDQEIAMMTVISQHRRKFDELRLASEDSNNTLEERVGYLKQAAEEEKKAVAIEAALQKEKVDIMRQRLEMGESTREEIRELAEEEAKLNQIYERGASAQKELASQVRTLSAQIVAQGEAALKTAKALNQIKPAEGGFNALKVKPVDASELLPTDSWQPQMLSMTEAYAALGLAVVGTSDLINDAFSSVTTGLAEWIGGMAAGQASFQGIAEVLAGTMADLAINLGKTAISAGIGIEAIKKSLVSLQGANAIAAGIALVALGSAIKGKLRSLASSGGGAGGVGGGSISSSSGTSSSYVNNSNLKTPQVPVQIVLQGELKAKGSDLALVLQKEATHRRIRT